MKYFFAQEIKKATGYVIFEVEAKTEQEAAAKAKEGKGDFQFEHISVEELGESKCIGLSYGRHVGKG